MSERRAAPGTLFRLVPQGEWPRCFHDESKLCGDPDTRGMGGPTDLELVRRGWHVADMCDTPSCPVRCAIRDALAGTTPASVTTDQIGHRIEELETALREIVDAAESLTRPGSGGQEHVNVARMSNAVQAGAALVGHGGIFPEVAL